MGLSSHKNKKKKKKMGSRNRETYFFLAAAAAGEWGACQISNMESPSQSSVSIRRGVVPRGVCTMLKKN